MNIEASLKDQYPNLQFKFLRSVSAADLKPILGIQINGDDNGSLRFQAEEVQDGAAVTPEKMFSNMCGHIDKFLMTRTYPMCTLKVWELRYTGTKMNTIFDYVGAILHTKDRSKFTTMDDEQSFQPFMVNRWVSMYSPEMATVVNTTTNKYANLFKNKQDLFNFYVTVFPKLRNKRIAYIKKTKESKSTKKPEDDPVPLMAQAVELSQREIRAYIEMQESWRLVVFFRKSTAYSIKYLYARYSIRWTSRQRRRV